MAESNRDLLGRKLAILYRIHAPDYALSEAVGVLQRVEDTVAGELLHIRRRTGQVLEVLSSDILELKPYPLA